MELVVCLELANEEVFISSIDNGFGSVAILANIYTPIWNPAQIGINKASELTEKLKAACDLLEEDPDRFTTLIPKGETLDTFTDFVRGYAEACEEYPEATFKIVY